MNHLQIWDCFFGARREAYDFAGRKMRREQYGTKSPYAWDVDHILPRAEGGKNGMGNLQIVSCLTNKEKADKITFYANGKLFQVKHKNKAIKREWARFDYSEKKYCVVQIGDMR